MTGPHLVTAWLDSPLAGDPPQLDALLEWSLSPMTDDFQRKQLAGLPHSRIDRRYPAPPQGSVAIPILRCRLGTMNVACCSDPILPRAVMNTVEHVNKKISTENASLLSYDSRRMVSTSNSWTKSYRLPLRIRSVPRVCWFAVTNLRNLKKALRDAHAIGKKVADGYGRVREWSIEPVANDWSWFTPNDSGTVLMRTLPEFIHGKKWLPHNLVGFRRTFGACVPPYWHPERFTEIVVPC